MNINPG